MNWHKKELNLIEVKQISERYRLSTLEAALLCRRKITNAEDLAFFLEENLSFTHSPFLFKEMTQVIDRLGMAQEEGEKALIFGDKDVDGITSATIASHMLTFWGIEHSLQIPNGEQLYGLCPQIVEEAYEKGITLIVTVDCGISAFEAINLANRFNIDVLVFDHHLAHNSQSVPARVVINPNVSGSGYPFPYLAGCGVVSKVFWASLYAKTPLYNIDFCFIEIEKNLLYLVHSRNTLTIKTLVIDLGNKSALDSFAQFAKGKILLTLCRRTTQNLLAYAFKTSFWAEFQDLQELLGQHMPMLKGMKLLELKKLSRRMRYHTQTLSYQENLLAFIALFFTEILLLPYKKNFEAYENILDLVALGTLADMMPLLNENRLLVKHGLKRLSCTQHTGLQALISLRSLQGKKLKAHNVTWQISPILNSAGRMGQAQLSLDLLMSKDLEHAFALSRQIISLNRQRKNIEVKIWQEAQEEVRQSYLDYKKRLALLIRKDIPLGLTGILASRIMKVFHSPALVLTLKNGLIKGSLRAPKGFCAKSFLTFIQDCLQDFGGHNTVAGFSLKEEKLPQLLEKIQQFTCEISSYLNCPPVNIDAYLPLNCFTPKLLTILERFEPFGHGHEEFIFEVRRVYLEHIHFIGDSSESHTVSLSVKGDKYRFQAIYWNGWTALEKLNLDAQTPVNIIFKFQESFYKGQLSQRMSILDIQLS